MEEVESPGEAEGGTEAQDTGVGRGAPKALLIWSRGLLLAARALYPTVWRLLPPKLPSEVFTHARPPFPTHTKLGQRRCVLGAPPWDSSALSDEREGSALPSPPRNPRGPRGGGAPRSSSQGSTTLRQPPAWRFAALLLRAAVRQPANPRVAPRRALRAPPAGRAAPRRPQPRSRAQPLDAPYSRRFLRVAGAWRRSRRLCACMSAVGGVQG